jgi:hypothetical protein
MKPKTNGIQEILESGQFPGLDTSQCRDADDIPQEKRVYDWSDTRSETAKERAFQEHIHERRTLVKEAGRNPNFGRMTHSVPADLFHGKIRETGDKNYWEDPRNVQRHKSCQVDP